MHTLLHRRDAGDAHHRRADHQFARQLHRGPGHRLRLHEGLRRHGDHGAAHLLVGVDHLGDIGGVVDDRGIAGDIRGVVDVGDGLRRDHRIAAVDVVEVNAADRVRRLIDLARRQREPADVARWRVADRHRDLEILAADKGHQRRCVHRALTPRAGHPGPGVVDVGPAAVVRNGIAPGRVIDPGPAPGVDPGPMAVAIRRPARGHAVRRPDVAVARIDTPGAIAVEVFVADDFARDIARRDRALAAAVALARPAVQIVVAPRRQRLVVGQAGAVEAIGAARIDGVGSAIAIDLGHAALHRDRSRVVVGIDLDAVIAGPAQGEGQIRCGHFKALPRPQAAHAQLQRALRQLHLGDAVVQIEQDQAGRRPHADRRAADLQFGARIGAGPQTIASGQRPVHRRPHPIGLASGREAHCAAEVTQARRARRRLRRSQAGEAQQQRAGKRPQRAAKVSGVHQRALQPKLRVG